MTKTTMRAWDPASNLTSTDAMATYREAALQDGDPRLFAAPLGSCQNPRHEPNRP